LEKKPQEAGTNTMPHTPATGSRRRPQDGAGKQQMRSKINNHDWQAHLAKNRLALSRRGEGERRAQGPDSKGQVVRIGKGAEGSTVLQCRN
jgi:hypothetical protein